MISRLRSLALPALLPALVIYLAFVLLKIYPGQQSDTSNFYLEGLLTFKGLIPYRDLADNKGPLLFYLLAAVAPLSGWNMIGGIVLFRLLDCVIFVLLVRQLQQMRFSGVALTVPMTVFAAAYGGLFPFRDETIYSEIPELLLRVLGYTAYFLRRPGRTGIYFSLAALFRQTALIDLAVVIVHQVALLARRQISGAQFRTAVGRTTVSFLIPVAVAALAAYRQGWALDFYRHAILWNYNFARLSVREPAIEKILFEQIFSWSLTPLIILAIAGIVVTILQAGKRADSDRERYQWFFCLVLAAHLYESFSSPLWFPHHLIPSLMILVILAAVACRYAQQQLSIRGVRVLERGALTGVTIISALSVLAGVTQHESLVRAAADDRVLGQWIVQGSSNSDRILVWGYAAQLYLYSQRLPGSRYLHNLSLTNQSGMFLPIDEQSRLEFQEDIKLNRPKFIILYSGKHTLPDLLKFAPDIEHTYIEREVPVDGKTYYLLEAKS